MNAQLVAQIAELVLTNEERLDDITGSLGIVQEFLVERFDLPNSNPLRAHIEQTEGLLRDNSLRRQRLRQLLAASLSRTATAGCGAKPAGNIAALADSIYMPRANKT